MLATEAVDLARRVDDPKTLAAALIALHDVSPSWPSSSRGCVSTPAGA